MKLKKIIIDYRVNSERGFFQKHPIYSYLSLRSLCLMYSRSLGAKVRISCHLLCLILDRSPFSKSNQHYPDNSHGFPLQLECLVFTCRCTFNKNNYGTNSSSLDQKQWIAAIKPDKWDNMKIKYLFFVQSINQSRIYGHQLAWMAWYAIDSPYFPFPYLCTVPIHTLQTIKMYSTYEILDAKI